MLPLRGRGGGLLVAFRSFIPVSILVSRYPIRCSVPAGCRGFLFVVTTLLWCAGSLCLISQVTTSFYSIQMSPAPFCLLDVRQHHAGLPPTGKNTHKKNVFQSSWRKSRYPKFKLIHHCRSSIMFTSCLRGMNRKVY